MRFMRRINRWLSQPRIVFAYVVGAMPACIVAGVGANKLESMLLGVMLGVTAWAVVGGLVYLFIDVKEDTDNGP